VGVGERAKRGKGGGWGREKRGGGGIDRHPRPLPYVLGLREERGGTAVRREGEIAGGEDEECGNDPDPEHQPRQQGGLEHQTRKQGGVKK
jgi:hypothetical protein